MSAETAVLLEVRELRKDVQRLVARLDVLSPTPWPDRMSTREAVLYVRVAYGRPRFNARTLYRWLAEERLTELAHPRRWLRGELDTCAGGTPISGEQRVAPRLLTAVNEDGRLQP